MGHYHLLALPSGFFIAVQMLRSMVQVKIILKWNITNLCQVVQQLVKN